MINRARQSVYWPGMESDIRKKRYNCHRCNEIAPSQPKEPIELSPSPDYPFQRICADYFEIGRHAYLSIVDRYTGWIIVYHFPEHARSEGLINACRKVFESYGVAEEISSDGGPQFIATRFKKFLEDWGVEHRLSSAHYPQSNGRGEIGVKVAKRIVYDHTSTDGSLDNDESSRAFLQYRNTPMKDTGLSPAQMLLHRQLRDHVPSSPELYKPSRSWLMLAADRERLFERRNSEIASRYNATAHALVPLSPRTAVTVQTKRKWDRSGVIVECLPHRQYRVRLDGSGRLVLRNRRFLKPALVSRPTIVPSPRGTVGNGSRERRTQVVEQDTVQGETVQQTASDDIIPIARDDAAPALTEDAASAPAETEHCQVQEPATCPRTPKALRDLADYNEKGEKEGGCLMSSRLRGRRK